jgi:6-phosphogluconolactonase
MGHGTRTFVQVFPAGAPHHRAAADEITTRLEAALAGGGRVSFVLTGGKTPAPVYELLASAPIPWDRVEFYWGDERAVPPAHPDSNFGMSCRTLIDPIGASPLQIHRIEGELPPPQAARRYELEVRRVDPAADVPRLDLVLLGLGEDGHTASLFPDAKWDDTRLVADVWVPKLAANRITMTPRLLNAARVVIFLVTGEAKAAALARVIEDGGSGLPAGRVAPADGTLIWMVDDAAASRMARR